MLLFIVFFNALAYAGDFTSIHAQNNGITKTVYYDKTGKIEQIMYSPSHEHVYEMELYYLNVKANTYCKIDKNQRVFRIQRQEYDTWEKAFEKNALQCDKDFQES